MPVQNVAPGNELVGRDHVVRLTMRIATAGIRVHLGRRRNARLWGTSRGAIPITNAASWNAMLSDTSCAAVPLVMVSGAPAAGELVTVWYGDGASVIGG